MWIFREKNMYTPDIGLTVGMVNFVVVGSELRNSKLRNSKLRSSKLRSSKFEVGSSKLGLGEC